MAKRRSQKPGHPLGRPEVPNPLDLNYIKAIGQPPSEREQRLEAAVLEAPPAAPASPAPVEPKPVPRSEPRPVPRQPTKRPTPRERATTRGGERPKDDHQYKTRVTPQEAAEIELFRETLSERLGVKLRFSQISRALLTIALRSEEELDSTPIPELRRPPYGDSLGMAAFEDELAHFLHALIKRTRRQG